ncbi:MAG: glycoside hydrolase family 38 C-terminal domain-containing protein [Candidatus Omnitrophota bacterium]
MKPSKRNYFHLICGTHWDREWLHPFAYTQSMLTEMMDDLLDYMEKHPEYRFFHLDSQTVVVEDYLRLRPENRQRFEKLVRAGRLLIGPYYSLPEMNHLTGESILRNFLMGYKVAEAFGGRMEVGYSPTSVGQISQMPQILRSVGLDTFIFYRGLRQDRSNLEFLWQGPDGSKVLGLRLTGPYGRAWFFAKLSMPVVYPQGVPQENLLELHNDISFQRNLECNFFTLSEYRTHYRPEDIAPNLKVIEKALSADTRSNHLLVMQAVDYGGPEKETVRIVKQINQAAGYEKIRFSAFPRFIRAFKKSIADTRPVVLKGELRDHRVSERDHILASAFLSAVTPLKILNRTAEMTLSRWAETWDTLSWTFTGKSAGKLLENSWKDLLATHAHDSVTGQGTDEVIRDVRIRLDQVRQAADGVTDYALGRLVSITAKPNALPNGVFLTVFNPSPFSRSEVVEINLDMPFYHPKADGNTDLPEIWLEDEIDRKRLIDPEEVSLQIIDQEGCPGDFFLSKTLPLEPVGISHPGWGGRRLNAHRYVIWFATGEVPGLGYRIFTAKLQKKERKNSSTKRPISPGNNTLENQYLKVTINQNGTMELLHKNTGSIYKGGHLFEDGMETGSSTRLNCLNPKRFTDLKADISLVENNHLAATYKIDLTLNVPAGAVSDERSRRSQAADPYHVPMINPLQEDRTCRPSRERADIPITSFVTLKKGSHKLEIVTQVENRARDHRLRVLFPTGLKTSDVWVDTPFDIVRRRINKKEDANPSLERPYATQPAVSFVDVNDERAGLALLHLGLIEYQVTDDNDRCIALTLLRCFQDQNKKCGALDYRLKETQLLGEHVFSYALLPHSGDTFTSGVHRQADTHLLPFKAIQSAGKGGNSLPLQGSLVNIPDKDLMLSAIKRSEKGNGLVIRLWNPTGRTIKTTISFLKPILRARLVDSLERPVVPLKSAKHGIKITAGPKKIISLEVFLRI